MIKMNIELDKRLKDAREAKGLSQNYVAEHLNITRQAISKWENGKSMPDLENLIILSTLYEISLDELLGRTPSPEETHEPQSSSANTHPFFSHTRSFISCGHCKYFLPVPNHWACHPNRDSCMDEEKETGV